MPRIPFSNNPIHVAFPGGSFHFYPQGPLSYISGPRNNPRLWQSEETWGVRLVMGLSIQGERKEISPLSIIDYVKRFCAFAGLAPDSSYIMQKGVYKYSGNGEVKTEKSLQIVILSVNNGDLPPYFFEWYMEILAEAMAVDFRQESIIVELQRNGVVQETAGVGPD